MSDSNPDESTDRTEPIHEHLHVEEIRNRSIFYERLSALKRDIALIVAAVGDRGDPREGATLGEITAAVARFYDDRRVSPASVEHVLEELVDADLIGVVGPDQYRASLNTAEQIEHYFERVGELWSDKIPEPNGERIEIERRQVTKSVEVGGGHE